MSCRVWMWNPKSLLCIESWNFEIEVDAAGFLLGQKLWKKNCNSGCDGGGICNMELAQCQCAVGFSGLWDLYFTALIDIAMSRPGYPWQGSAAACMWANLVKQRKCKQAGGRWTLRSEWVLLPFDQWGLSHELLRSSSLLPLLEFLWWDDSFRHIYSRARPFA